MARGAETQLSVSFGVVSDNCDVLWPTVRRRKVPSTDFLTTPSRRPLDMDPSIFLSTWRWKLVFPGTLNRKVGSRLDFFLGAWCLGQSNTFAVPCTRLGKTRQTRHSQLAVHHLISNVTVLLVICCVMTVTSRATHNSHARFHVVTVFAKQCTVKSRDGLPILAKYKHFSTI